MQEAIKIKSVFHFGCKKPPCPYMAGVLAILVPVSHFPHSHLHVCPDIMYTLESGFLEPPGNSDQKSFPSLFSRTL